MNTKLLRIYLNDHLAGSLVGRELAKRCSSNNKGTELARFLDSFVGDVESEREILRGLLKELGATEDKVKQAGGWVAERLGRLKLNGQLAGYSDLSRVIELETLCMGVEGKLSLWRSLKEIESDDPRLGAADWDELIERASRHRRELESHRLAATATAFRSSGS